MKRVHPIPWRAELEGCTAWVKDARGVPVARVAVQFPHAPDDEAAALATAQRVCVAVNERATRAAA